MKIAVSVLIEASIEVVWAAFNDPADIVQWDASSDWRVTRASNDLQVGGMLKLRIEPTCGDASFDFIAIYTQIEPMRLIEWQEDDRHVSVKFAKTRAGVVIHQEFDAEPPLSVDDQRRDWQGVLDNFARHVTGITA